MNRKLATSLVLMGALAVSAGRAPGQEGPPPPPMHGGPGAEFAAPPFGERMELLGLAGMHNGKVVTGAPFSAVAVSETVHTLADGNRITRKTQTNLYRDSQGRVRKEGTVPSFAMMGHAPGGGQLKSFVVIMDPVAGTNYLLHPDTKIAETMGRHGKGPMNEAMKDTWQSKSAAREQEEIANGNLKRESLGTKTPAEIEWAGSERPQLVGKENNRTALTLQGTRMTRTIPAGQIGNEKAITIVHESWYSNDLQMVVLSKRSDPWSGETTYTLTNIQRTEPDAGLFAVPADYTVKAGGHGPGPRGMMRRSPMPPPANN